MVIYLCRCGRENLRSMTRKTFAVRKDGMGREYVYQLDGEMDKNHNEEANPSDTIGEGIMYEQPEWGEMCPVASYKKYLSKLNTKCEALWQRPLDSFLEEDEVWYCNMAMGENSLGGMMSRISEQAKLSYNYTNHCLRATAIVTLDESGFEARHIARISGHK